MRNIGQVSDSFANVVHGLMSEWKVLRVVAIIDGKHKGALDGTWVHGGGIEIPWVYFLYELKVHKSSVW